MAAPSLLGSVAEYGSTAAESTHTFSATLSAGSNRVLIVAASIYDYGAYDTLTATYNGVAMTEFSGSPIRNSGYEAADLTVFYMLESDLASIGDGAHNVVVTRDAWMDPAACIGAFFQDVDQTTPFGTVATEDTLDAGDSQILDVASATGETAVCALAFQSNGYGVGPAYVGTGTEIGYILETGYSFVLCQLATRDGATTAQFEWDSGTSGNNTCLLGVSLKPAAAGGGAAIDVPAVAMTIAALTPGVSAGASVSVPAAAMAMTALTPSVSTGALVAAPASAMAIASHAPSVASGASVSAPVAAMAIAAHAPSVASGASIAVPAAAMAMTALTPSVGAGVAIGVPLVSMSMAAYAPTVSGGVAIGVPLVSMSMAAYAPAVSSGASVSVLWASMSMAAYAPSVASGASVAAPASVMALAVHEPTITTGGVSGVAIDVPLISLALATYAPAVSSGASIAVPVVSMSMAVPKPTITAGATDAGPLFAFDLAHGMSYGMVAEMVATLVYSDFGGALVPNPTDAVVAPMSIFAGLGPFSAPAPEPEVQTVSLTLWGKTKALFARFDRAMMASNQTLEDIIAA